MKLRIPLPTGKSIVTLLATIALDAAVKKAGEVLAKRAEKKDGPNKSAG